MLGVTRNTTEPEQKPDMTTEELLSLPRDHGNYVTGLTARETQRLADALGEGVSTMLPGGRWLYLEPEEDADMDDSLLHGPAA